MLNMELIQIMVNNERRIKISLDELAKMINNTTIKKQTLRKALDELYEQLEEKIYNTFYYIYNKVYLETHYTIQNYFKIEYDFNSLKDDEVYKKIKENFLHATICKRLQKQKKKLMETIKQEFSKDLDKREVYKAIKRRLQVAQSDLRRLMVTEGNRIVNESIRESFDEVDFIEQVIFIATLDNRTSKICRSMDGKIFNKKDLVVGVNEPPLHPHCRSVLGVYEDGMLKKRIERDVKTGKSKIMDEYLTFEQWKEKNKFY